MRKKKKQKGIQHFILQDYIIFHTSNLSAPGGAMLLQNEPLKRWLKNDLQKPMLHLPFTV